MRTACFYTIIPFFPIVVPVLLEEAAPVGSKSRKSGKKPSLRNRYFRFLFLLVAGIVTLGSCKKSEIVKTDLPAFGTCKPVPLTGALSYNPTSATYTYNSKGGGIIVIAGTSPIKFLHKDYSGFEVVWWGDLTVGATTKLSANHENLNGKHIKDRVGSIRSFKFPDGTKLTLTTDGEKGQILSISIFEAETSYRINYTCNTVEYVGNDPLLTKKLDDSEPDGETAAIEFTATGLLYLNIYNEQSIGNRIDQRVPLGEINRAQPTQVRDYYDDLRLGHT